MKTDIVIDISPPIPYLEKFWFSSYGPKCRSSCIILWNVISQERSESSKWRHRTLLQAHTFILNLRNMSKVPKIRSLHVFAISPEKHGRMKLIFCQQINTKVFYKMILSLWVCDASHVQSTQNKKTEILCNISRKTWRMKLVFCRQINVKCFFKLILSA